MPENNILEHALKYREMGLSVIPCIPPTKDKEGKDIKKPRIPWTPYQDKLASKEEITGWFKKWPDSRIGIVTGKLSNLFVVDIDSEEAKTKLDDEYIPDSLILPVCQSPRGGYHYYFKHKDGLCNKTKIDNMALDTRGAGGFIMAPPSQGLDGKSYQWITGCSIFDVPLADLPEPLYYIINSYSLYSTGGDLNPKPQMTTMTTTDHNYFVPGRQDEDLFHAANCLIKGGADREFTFQTLERITQTLTNDFGPKEANEKIKSALKRAETKERNIAREVEDWVLTTNGHFLTTDGHKELQLTTRAEKKAANMAFLRLAEQKPPIIERYGDKRGAYRVVERDCQEIQWWDSGKDQAIDVRWFLGLEKLIFTMPKSIYVIAGDQDGGKSALCLNMAILNCRRHNVFYYSSEMAAQELGNRLQLYEGFNLELFREKIKFMDRSRDFADVIQPDSINIIDYLEISDNFYLIAKDLTNIRDKLNKGIAIIALQKKRGADLGRGAEFSLEKPRLYLSVGPYYPYKSKTPDGNAIKIIKAKNWAQPDHNPNGQFHKFKLSRGINIFPAGTWEEEYE